MFFLACLVSLFFICLLNWKARTESKSKAKIAKELSDLDKELEKKTEGLDDSVISYDGPDGKKKTRPNRFIGGIDYMHDIDDEGNIRNDVKSKEVRLK